MRARSELSDLELAVLSFLRSSAKGSRVEFELEELAARVSERVGGTVGLTQEALERALLELERKGYLRIVRVPPSSIVVRERVREELKELNAAFIAGRLGPSTYAARFSETASKRPLLSAKPLPPAGLSDVLKGVAMLLESLEKLENTQAGEEAKEVLREKYVSELEAERELLEARLLIEGAQRFESTSN